MTEMGKRQQGQEPELGENVEETYTSVEDKGEKEKSCVQRTTNMSKRNTLPLTQTVLAAVRY